MEPDYNYETPVFDPARRLIDLNTDLVDAASQKFMIKLGFKG